MGDLKAMIKNAYMWEEMQQDSMECATQALEKYNIEKDIAAHIKKVCDKKYKTTCYCIWGRNFSRYMTHDTKLYFYLAQVTILLFKSIWSMAFASCPNSHPDLIDCKPKFQIPESKLS